MNDKRNRILIVDDERININFLADILKTEYEIFFAKNGEQALKRVYSNRLPDLILLDIVMPGIDGYEVCRQLKADSKTQHIPIIFISAKSGDLDETKGLEAGAVDYITKPISPPIVLARVKTQLKLKQAYHEITTLNEQLKSENIRMCAEINVSHQLQQMLLPKPYEINKIEGLDIACFMEPANEVGGDYYDILQHDGRVLIGIGDVTGHGLESGALAIMVQSAVRTLLAYDKMNPVKFLNALNQMVFHNVARMELNKNLTLAFLDYQDGQLSLSGQHEEIIVVRQGKIELIDTLELGFPIGLLNESIVDSIAEVHVSLNQGDVVVLYTDGITEALNPDKVEYGLERLCEVIKQNWQHSAQDIRQAVIDNLQQYIGIQKVSDDITLLVLKQQ